MIRRESIPRWSPAALLLVVVYAVIITLMNHGHRWTLAPDQQASVPATRVVRVSPSELFTGDLKRLEPHLDLTASGCVKLEAPGPELFIGIEIELWQAGKARFMGSSSTLVREPDVVSFSIRELADAKDKRQFLFIGAVSAKDGGSSERSTIDAPEKGSYTFRGTNKMSLLSKY